MLEINRTYRLCSLEEKDFTYSVEALWPRFSPTPCYAEMLDELGTRGRIQSLAGGPLPEMISLTASASTGPRSGSWLLFVTVHIPAESQALAGWVIFKINGVEFREPLWNGFPRGCFEYRFPAETSPPPSPPEGAPPPPPLLPFPPLPWLPDRQNPLNPFDVRNFDPEDRGELAFHIRAINILYTDIDGAIDWVTPWSDGGELRTIPVDDRSGTGIMVLNHPSRVVVWICGTTTNQQLLDQGNSYIRGGVDDGRFTCNVEHIIGQTPTLDLLLGMAIDPDKPIAFIGHSMGGAIALLLGVRFYLARPHRHIAVITYGSPKPGDERFIRFTQNFFVKAIENTGDPIPFLPPNLEEAGPAFLAVVPLDLRTNVTVWRHCRNREILDPNGALVPGAIVLPFLDVARQQLQRLVLGLAIDVGQFQHLPLEYARRLEIPRA